jgi:Protein of unknown function (DUF4199)
MTRTVLIFGLISGGILAAVMAITMPLYLTGHLDSEHSEVLGYTTMVVAFLLTFFGMRSYRENNGGTITFGRAFKIGLLITLIASAMYVITWEIIYYGFFPNFADSYAAHAIEKARASGATPAAIEKTRQKMAQFKEWYKNPLINIGMTFIEVFPVGLIMTLISAGILRRVQTPVQFSNGRSAAASR